MYVVRRAFRNYNQMIIPGSIIEPGNIKWFKTRLKDRAIVEVNAHNFEQWFAYFKAKFGVELADPVATDSLAEGKSDEIDSYEDKINVTDSEEYEEDEEVHDTEPEEPAVAKATTAKRVVVKV